MDWGKFFEQTRRAAGVDSFAKLAPLLHVSDGAISHYRTGRRVPEPWTVAAALRIQGVPNPEKRAADLLEKAAANALARQFWRRLGTAAAVVLATGMAALQPLPAAASVGQEAARTMHYAHIRRRIAALVRLYRAWSRHGHPAALLPV